MERHLHIICLNVPYPVDYGGVFDLFYKLPILKQLGIKIHLHCFKYGRGEQAILNQYCEEVHYYKRLKGVAAASFTLPYIVASRKNEDLLARLAEDEYPILMEGIHCTYLLTDLSFANRKCFVRLHNVEHTYYKNLSKYSNSVFKKAYYYIESKLLFKYETSIANKATYLAVTPKDVASYKTLGSKNIEFLPLFLPNWKVKSKVGKGSFCLYHGDLSVAENEKAALWLLKKVFTDLDIPFVIAGKNPSKKLLTIGENKNGMCIVSNPSAGEMQDMIEKAHINIIPSFNNTGIKLKLINALFNGRHCLVNETTVEGTSLETTCHIQSTAEEFKSAIKNLMTVPFTERDFALRSQLLDSMFNNEANAKQLVSLIWTSDKVS